MDSPWPISYSVGKYAEGVRSCSLKSPNDVAQCSIVGDSNIPNVPASTLDEEPVASNESVSKIC